MERIRKGDFKVIDLFGIVDEIMKVDGKDSVVALYKSWIENNSNDPLLFAVLYNAGTVYTSAGLFNDAQESFEKSIALNPDFAQSHINLGTLYEKKGQLDLAVAEWTAVFNRPGAITGTNILYKTIALNQTARILEANNRCEAAEICLQQSLEIRPSQLDVAQHYITVRMRECKWPVIEPSEHISRDVLMKGISPLSVAAYTDDPMLQLATSFYYNMRDLGTPQSDTVVSYNGSSNNCKTDAPLRIGYLSSDLRAHAIGMLTSEIFELHNRQKVEIFAYYCGISKSDAIMERIKKNVDHWIPIQDMDDETAARRINDDGIQILIDVNGYTGGMRMKLLAMRPAPIIVNWLGFPGTMGSPYHHYIIADEWIIPPEYDIYYSEKVMRLPCYQPNDRKRSAAEKKPTRKEANLPENALVYCCFNGAQKISQFTFERWMTILSRVEGSVLWLLGATETSRNRLRSIAQARGILPDRIIFAEQINHVDHLARIPLADLFLDTHPYGAHTTASDALWMGVPILTLSGRSFASRVCGSLVRAAGFPDLVCTTPEEYVDRAVALGRDREALRHYRAKLAATRDSCVLFDTPLLVRSLERLYETMWKDFKNGRLPQPDLRNLDVYLEIGIQNDCDKVEVLSIQDYTSWWQTRLSQRDAVRPFYPDDRFWTEKIARRYRKKAVKEDGKTRFSYWRGGLSRIASLRKAAAKRR
jgi:predicted O-linked N-acetylglucosamine transferase (SPINDLY family)